MVQTGQIHPYYWEATPGLLVGNSQVILVNGTCSYQRLTVDVDDDDDDDDGLVVHPEIMSDV